MKMPRMAFGNWAVIFVIALSRHDMSDYLLGPKVARLVQNANFFGLVLLD